MSNTRLPQLPWDIVIMILARAIDAQRGPNREGIARTRLFPTPLDRDDPDEQRQTLVNYALVNNAFFQQTRRGVREIRDAALVEEQTFSEWVYGEPKEYLREYIDLWEIQASAYLLEDFEDLPEVWDDDEPVRGWTTLFAGRQTVKRVDMLRNLLKGMDTFAALKGWS